MEHDSWAGNPIGCIISFGMRLGPYTYILASGCSFCRCVNCFPPVYRFIDDLFCIARYTSSSHLIDIFEMIFYSNTDAILDNFFRRHLGVFSTDIRFLKNIIYLCRIMTKYQTCTMDNQYK